MGLLVEGVHEFTCFTVTINYVAMYPLINFDISWNHAGLRQWNNSRIPLKLYGGNQMKDAAKSTTRVALSRLVYSWSSGHACSPAHPDMQPSSPWRAAAHPDMQPSSAWHAAQLSLHDMQPSSPWHAAQLALTCSSLLHAWMWMDETWMCHKEWLSFDSLYREASWSSLLLGWLLVSISLYTILDYSSVLRVACTLVVSRPGLWG